jgi:hypothetical protein
MRNLLSLTIHFNAHIQAERAALTTGAQPRLLALPSTRIVSGNGALDGFGKLDANSDDECIESDSGELFEPSLRRSSVPIIEPPSDERSQLRLLKEMIFACDVDFCGRIFSHELALQLHRRDVHNMAPEPALDLSSTSCELCLASFADPRHLQQHFAMHHTYDVAAALRRGSQPASAAFLHNPSSSSSSSAAAAAGAATSSSSSSSSTPKTMATPTPLAAYQCSLCVGSSFSTLEAFYDHAKRQHS